MEALAFNKNKFSFILPNFSYCRKGRWFDCHLSLSVFHWELRLLWSISRRHGCWKGEMSKPWLTITSIDLLLNTPSSIREMQAPKLFQNVSKREKHGIGFQVILGSNDNATEEPSIRLFVLNVSIKDYCWNEPAGEKSMSWAFFE